MDAITKGNGNKYTINAKDLQFQVRTMSMHELHMYMLIYVCALDQPCQEVVLIFLFFSEKVPDMILHMYEALLREVQCTCTCTLHM